MSYKFFPHLSSSSKKNVSYHIDLFFQENSNEQTPIITFIGEDNNIIGNLEEKEISGSELVKHSFSNLREVELILDKSEKSSVLFNLKDKHASEKILDKDFLKEAALILNTKVIEVAIPVRDCIIIADADSEEQVSEMESQVNKIYNDFSREKLTRLIFRIEDGIIKSTRTSEVKIISDTLEQDFPEGFEYSQSKSKLFGELYNAKILAGADKVEDFLNGLFILINQAIIEHKSNPDFNGTIEVLSEIQKPEKNRHNSTAVKEFIRNLADNPVIKSSVKDAKMELKLSFMFSVDFRSGNTHKKLIKSLN